MALSKRSKLMGVKLPGNWGTTLLAIWLIVTGAVPLLGIGSGFLSTVLSVLAVASGILLLMNR